MPEGLLRIIAAVQSEPIRRVAVDVYPRVRCGVNGNQRQAQSQQKTTAARLLVLVLVERPPRSVEKGRKRPMQRKRIATAAAPSAREVPRIPFGRSVSASVGVFCRLFHLFLPFRRPRTSLASSRNTSYRTCSCPACASGPRLPLPGRTLKEEEKNSTYATSRSCRARTAPRISSCKSLASS